MADILDKRPLNDEMTIFKTEVEPYKLNACIDNILMRVDRLETKFADVQLVNRWISCKDEMPPIGCDVIVCYNQGYVDIGYYGISAWFIRGNSFEERVVSHWQPLPELPKGAKNV